MSFQTIVTGPACTYGDKTAGVTKSGRPYVRNRHAGKIRVWQEQVRHCMTRDKVAAMIMGAVELRIRVYMRRPKSHWKRDKKDPARMVLTKKGLETPFPARAPDWDKVGRAVADCGTGIWYVDDRMVVSGQVVKLWAGFNEPERTEIFAEPL